MKIGMIINIAWRNVWRSKYRSLIVISAIAIGLWAGIFMMAFSWGMYDQRIREAIKNEISHFQIHNPEFLQKEQPGLEIADPATILATLRNDPQVQAVTERGTYTAMVKSSYNSAGVKLMVIDPEMEQGVTGLQDKLVEGTYFEGTPRTPQIIMSKRLANKMKLKLHHKHVYNFQTSADTTAALGGRVIGFFETNNAVYDLSHVFITRQAFDAEMKTTTGIHEIAVLLNDNREQEEVLAKYKKQYPDLAVQGWREVAPELGFAIDSFDQFMRIFIIIILIALAFGIINTMLMSILERVRELGMLMAIGMSRPRIFIMIMVETVFLTLVGAPLGMLLSFVTILLTAHSGIDLSMFGDGLGAIGFSSMVYPKLDIDSYLEIGGLAMAVTLLASIYPSIKALQLNPVDAIRNA